MPISTSVRFNDYWEERAITALFRAESIRMNKWMLSLCQQHTAATGAECYGFKYKAERFIPEEYMDYMRRVRDLPTISITLSEEIIRFYTEMQRIDKDKHQIKQLFALLLVRCNSRYDVRNALPECVVALTGLQDEFSRAFPEAANLNSFGKEQYDRLLPKIQMYSVVHLINS
jgi:hypothetical protein